MYHSSDLSTAGEKQFIELGLSILKGDDRSDRTGTGTISVFGRHLRFDLRAGFPLLTTRKMFFRGIVEEFLFFINGHTNTNLLEDKGIKVWSGNTSREFLDKCNLMHLPTGDMGPSYGFQLRHFGASYNNCFDNYTGQGVDQLAALLHSLKYDMYGRRHIVSLWNPVDLHAAPLPPCLHCYQFYVNVGDNGARVLSCMMTQRSSDYCVAGGWNIAFGALFTMFLAHLLDYEVGELHWMVGDVHIYKNLVGAFLAQSERTVRPAPTLQIVPVDMDVNDTDADDDTDDPSSYIHNMLQKIKKYKFENFKLIGYNPHESIQLQMSV